MRPNRLLVIAAWLMSPALCLSQNERQATSQPVDEPMALKPVSAPRQTLPPPRGASALPSPPFPSTDYVGPVCGTPDAPCGYPFMTALYKTGAGDAIKASRIKAYGWVEGSFNWSTSKLSNSPEGYALVPNHPEVSQGVFRVERNVDTAQTDHLDWGFRFTNVYGTDYRYSIAKGWFSRQLLEKNELYGYDTPEAYALLYIPSIAEGTTVKIGRFFSPVDIESFTAPDNYLFTHSLMNTFDAVTFTGVLADVRLNKNWTIQLGAHAGSDMTPWDDGALNGHAMVRWSADDNNDSIFAGLNSIGDGKIRDDHDNLQQAVAVWSHKFSDKFHTATEVYYQWQRGGYLGGNVNYGPTKDFGGGGGPGWYEPGMTDSVGAVNYLEYQLSDKDYVSFRNDYLWDDQGQRTGLRNSYTSHTLGWCHYLTEWMMVRPEIRYEKSYNLPAFDNGVKSSQFMFAVDLIIRF